MIKKRIVALLLVGSVASISRVAWAADPPAQPAPDLTAEAKEQYNAGLEAFNGKRFVEAALHFEAATAKNPHAVSWYMAAQAWEQAVRPERAADALTRALEVPGLSDELGEKIRTRLRVLEGTLGTLTLTGPDGYRVALDGGTSVSLPARLHALPGAHSLTVQPPDRAPTRKDVTVQVGQLLPIELVAEEVTQSAPRIDIVERVKEVPRPAEPRKYVGFAAIGVGGATFLGAIVLGASALDARDAYRTTRTQSDYDHVRFVQTWTNVAWVTGAVFTAGGLALVLWPSNDKSADKASRASSPSTARLTIAPAGAGVDVRGSF